MKRACKSSVLTFTKDNFSRNLFRKQYSIFDPDVQLIWTVLRMTVIACTQSKFAVYENSSFTGGFICLWKFWGEEKR